MIAQLQPGLSRTRGVVARDPNGRPRTYRLEPAPGGSHSRPAGYRRLALAILGLDVATLAGELHAGRCIRLAA